MNEECCTHTYDDEYCAYGTDCGEILTWDNMTHEQVQKFAPFCFHCGKKVKYVFPEKENELEDEDER